MNRPALLVFLLLSLVGNAAMLIAMAARPTLAPRAWQPVVGGARIQPATTSAPHSAAATRSQTARLASDRAVRAQLWSTLDTADLRVLITRLRAAGFPALVIRAIINARVDAGIQPRFDELFGNDASKPFWKADGFGVFLFSDPKKAEAYFQLYRDRSRQLRELLGDDIGVYAADPTAEQRRRFGNLSPEKIDRVQRINDDYDEMMSQLRAATAGVMLPEDRRKLELLEQEKKADLAAVLTPQEAEDYQMRQHWLTSQLSGTMTLMNATEAEFREIFRLQKNYQDNLNTLRPSEAFVAGGYGSDQPSPLMLELHQQLKAALGEMRYAEYARASENEFQQLVRIAQRENVPLETATRVFALRAGVAQESNRIYDDAALSLEQKRTALQSLAQRTRTQILSALGPAAGPGYVQAARWLTTVERGGAISFSVPNMMSSKKLPTAPAGP